MAGDFNFKNNKIMALISDWMSRCLLCMSDQPARVSVFGSHGQRKSVTEMIDEFLNVTVTERDNFPRNICEKCFETLLKVNELKAVTHESLHHLQLLQNFHKPEQRNKKEEYIRLWLGSQGRQQAEMPVYDEHNVSNQQQHSDFTCSSISVNEAASSVGFNVSASSDALNNTHTKAVRQGKSGRGRKRPGTPCPISAPSSRSCSPQPGALPPESSKKQFRSTARSQLKNHSKIAVQQNGIDGLTEKNIDYSGLPQPGSVHSETTGKGSPTQKQPKDHPVNSVSAPLQSKGNNAMPEQLEKGAENHRARSCSPFRDYNCSVSPVTPVVNKKRRGRPRSNSVPPSKRSKVRTAKSLHKSSNEIARTHKPWKPYLDDDVSLDRVITTCDLNEFRKRIPYVSLIPINAPVSKPLVPQFPLPNIQQADQDFRLVEEIQNKEKGIVQQFCWICNKTFPSNKNMQEHLLAHREKSAFESSSEDVPEPSCESATQSPIASNSAQSQSTKSDSFQKQVNKKNKCTECEEMFQTLAALERHMANHNRCCQVCDVVFRTTEDFQNHKKSHDKPQQGSTCPCCLLELASEAALNKHMMQHKKCTLCNKTFPGKNELAAHVGESHKVCNICDETLVDEEELKSHIETSHEKCNLCGELFLGEEELNTHLNKHPFQCMLCLSAFSDKTQRNEHLRTSHQDMLELLKKHMASGE